MIEQILYMNAMNIARTICFCVLLLLASVMDIKSRTIPDSISIILVVISLVPPEPMRIPGILAAFPLLIAGLTIGGIGGGDIKLTGACGMVLGLEQAFMGLLIGLLLLLIFHIMRSVGLRNSGKRECKENRKGWQQGQAYPLVPFLTAGIFLVM